MLPLVVVIFIYHETLIFLALLFISCSTSSKREFFTYNQNEKQLWIDSYKYEAFYGCINEGMGNDSLRIILQRKDLFNRNAEVDFLTIDEAREFGKQIINEMPKPFVKNEEEDKDKNFMSYYCLVYYGSHELDSIANAEYKKYKQRQDKL